MWKADPQQIHPDFSQQPGWSFSLVAMILCCCSVRELTTETWELMLPVYSMCAYGQG